MSNLAEEAVKEHYQYVYEKDRENINYQPYRTTPLVTPAAKVKRDTPINSCYLAMHPDPQVRGRNLRQQVNPTLNNLLDQANHQLAMQVANQVKSAANNYSRADSTDHGPKVVHHQFNTPIDLYSPGNAAQSLENQTGISTNVSERDRQFSIQNSQALKAILENDQNDPVYQRRLREQQKNKSHVVFDLHEAKEGVWPPPDLTDQRTLPPPGERPVRQVVEQPNRELPTSPVQDNPFQGSARTINEKIAQSYSFNKVMWAMNPLDKL